jgi:hypothetical protein
MKRYSIMVRERGADRETEFCAVDSGADTIALGLRLRTISVPGKGKRKVKVPKFEHVHIVDRGSP